MSQKVYNVENEEVVLKEISKLKPLNYNRFRWWRRFDQPKKQLANNAPLLDKIKNGDLDFSHYWWQAKYTEIELNSQWRGSADTQHFIETTQVDRARRKRLYEDFERDESEKLQYIKKQFVKEFFITEKEYEAEMLEFEGTLEELYHHCTVIYGKKIKIKKRKKHA